MHITFDRFDPMPDVPRGTLEYAASAGVCRDMVCVMLSAQEAADVREAMRQVNTDHADAHLSFEAFGVLLAALLRLQGLPDASRRGLGKDP